MTLRMPHASESRARRVKLAGTVLALVRMENGRQITAKLHQLSITGGMLWVETPLYEGIKVEVLFHVGTTTIRTRAVTRFPMWATNGTLQPFEFSGLDDDERQQLQIDLEKLLNARSS